MKARTWTLLGFAGMLVSAAGVFAYDSDPSSRVVFVPEPGKQLQIAFGKNDGAGGVTLHVGADGNIILSPAQESRRRVDLRSDGARLRDIEKKLDRVLEQLTELRSKR